MKLTFHGAAGTVTDSDFLFETARGRLLVPTAPRPPGQVLLVQGEPVPADAVRRKIEETQGLDVYVAKFCESVELA